MVPPFPIDKITGRLAKFAADVRRREFPTEVLETLGSQVRSLLRKRPTALTRSSMMQASIPVSAPAVPTEHAIAGHLATLVQKRLKRLVDARHFEAAADRVDAVHDLRVASRRLRAIVEVFEPILSPQSNEARKNLRAITRAARPVRDLHVQLNYLRDCYSQTTSDLERVVLEELMARTAERTKREEQRLRKRLKKLDWNKVKRTLSVATGEAITQLPSTEQAVFSLTWQLIEPLTRLTMDCVQPTQTEQQPLALHELRIMVKKLRYALEIFEPVFGPTFTSLYEPVESLQESLGLHHDIYVLEGYVKQQRLELERGQRTTLARAMRVLEQKLSARRQALFEDALNHKFDIASWQQAVRAQLQ